MKTVKASSVCLLFLGTILIANDAFAQNRFKFPFRKSKPVPVDEHTDLMPSDGPWLIMCASFVDEEGERQAQNLVRELRTKYKLKAYIYRHQFDFGDTIEGIGWQVVERQGVKDIVPGKRMKTAGSSHFEEIAVLVGDFPNVEDSRAQKTLQDIKMLQPDSLANFDPSRGSSQRLRMYREIVKQISKNPESKAKGPLRAAFLMINPTLPEEYFAANQVDHFVINLNKRVKHSLLENPATYSVRVATFRGETTFNINEIEEKEKEFKLFKRIGKPVKNSKLAEAFNKAHLLTEELRDNGIEAYEFHDRYESYVCVGSYDWISRTDANGAKINNPEIVKVINTLKATVENVPNYPGVVAPQVLPKFRKTDIFFDAQPIPVLVPKADTRTSSRLKPWR